MCVHLGDLGGMFWAVWRHIVYTIGYEGDLSYKLLCNEAFV